MGHRLPAQPPVTSSCDLLSTVRSKQNSETTLTRTLVYNRYVLSKQAYILTWRSWTWNVLSRLPEHTIRFDFILNNIESIKNKLLQYLHNYNRWCAMYQNGSDRCSVAFDDRQQTFVLDTSHENRTVWASNDYVLFHHHAHVRNRSRCHFDGVFRSVKLKCEWNYMNMYYKF